MTWPAGLELRIIELMPIGILLALASTWGAELFVLRIAGLIIAIRRLLEALHGLVESIDDR